MPEENTSLNCTITVTRNSTNDNQQRQVIVKMDDKPFATLLYGRTATKPVACGKHSMKVDNTWSWKTVKFELKPGEHAKFQLINRSGRFTWFMVALLGAGPMYLTVERTDAAPP
jgi:hypothetical protein